MEKRIFRNKWVLYSALLFTIMVLETTILPRIKIFGATPTHLLPYAVCVIAMLEGALGGALSGLIAGIISDTLLVTPDGFYTLTYVICGIATAFFCTLVFWRNYPVTLLYFFVFILLTRIIYFTIFFLIFGDSNILPFLTTIPAEFFASALFSPLVYFCIYRIAKNSGLDEEELQ